MEEKKIMKTKIKKNWVKATVVSSVLILGIIIGISANLILYGADAPEIVKEQLVPEKPKSWKNIVVGDAPGGPGVKYVMIYEHQASPGTAYASNLSNASASCYEFHDGLNANLGNNVPYDTPFDMVLKCEYNDTHAYNTTSSQWMMDWVKGLITCADLGISADTEMSEVHIWNNSAEMEVHFYMNNGGTGYTISHGESVNSTNFKQQAYY
jgi:hypothetical protein